MDMFASGRKRPKPVIGYFPDSAYLGRDPCYVEDLDSHGPDHGADAVRYGCLPERHTYEVMKLMSLIRG